MQQRGPRSVRNSRGYSSCYSVVGAKCVTPEHWGFTGMISTSQMRSMPTQPQARGRRSGEGPKQDFVK